MSPTHPAPPHRPRLGGVVIGRNEGERLVRCLKSLLGSEAPLVYVDSGSSDGSPERAAELGAEVVKLPDDLPFTAARARNAGFARLMSSHPDVTYVQFVDGDCEIVHDWLAFAVDFLERNPDVAIVCGRRKERYPQASIYNLLCDIEWDTPVGEAESSGGDFLVRASVFQAVRGFTDDLIAGEEPEMCYRMRKLGWKVYRADRLMTLHDAAMSRFGQWVKRTSRAGYAYAARAALHLRDGGRYCWRENLRISAWAFGIPLVIALSALTISPWAALLLLVYPLNVLRLARQTRKRKPGSAALAYAFFTTLGKWPEFYGQVLFLVRGLRRQQQRIIEYK